MTTIHTGDKNKLDTITSLIHSLHSDIAEARYKNKDYKEQLMDYGESLVKEHISIYTHFKSSHYQQTSQEFIRFLSENCDISDAKKAYAFISINVFLDKNECEFFPFYKWIKLLEPIQMDVGGILFEYDQEFIEAWKHLTSRNSHATKWVSKCDIKKAVSSMKGKRKLSSCSLKKDVKKSKKQTISVIEEIEDSSQDEFDTQDYDLPTQLVSKETLVQQVNYNMKTIFDQMFELLDNCNKLRDSNAKEEDLKQIQNSSLNEFILNKNKPFVYIGEGICRDAESIEAIARILVEVYNNKVQDLPASPQV